jgi:hypothetical protein
VGGSGGRRFDTVMPGAGKPRKRDDSTCTEQVLLLMDDRTQRYVQGNSCARSHRAAKR